MPHSPRRRYLDRTFKVWCAAGTGPQGPTHAKNATKNLHRQGRAAQIFDRMQLMALIERRKKIFRSN